MPRYTIQRPQPKLWWHYMPEAYEPTATPALTVHSEAAKDTGLLDVDGNKIMKSPERIGFPLTKGET